MSYAYWTIKSKLNSLTEDELQLILADVYRRTEAQEQLKKLIDPLPEGWSTSNGVIDWGECLMYAVKHSNCEIARLALTQKPMDVHSALWHACQKHDLPMVELLLNKVPEIYNWEGQEIDEEDDWNMSSLPEFYDLGLSGAANGGHLDLIERLVALGATDMKDVARVNPNHPHIVEYLNSL